MCVYHVYIIHTYNIHIHAYRHIQNILSLAYKYIYMSEKLSNRHTIPVFITVLFVYYPYMVLYSIMSFLLKPGQDLLNDPHHPPSCYTRETSLFGSTD